MSNIKLRNNLTGEITEKTELNWKHLPNDRKALYTVVNDEGLTAQPAKNFTPPELQPKTEDEKKEAIKAIAKDVAAHFKTVEKIVNAYLKK